MTEKIYTSETIEDVQFPTLITDTTTALGSATNTSSQLSPNEVPEQAFPRQTIANDVISSSFDSQQRRILGEYEFAVNGALQIGKYVSGTSGDVRITPDGIVGRNSAGATTFSIDAVTGDATFKGTIAAGSLIAGRTDIGVSNGNVYIDGANARIIISDGTYDRILIGKQVGAF